MGSLRSIHQRWKWENMRPVLWVLNVLCAHSYTYSLKPPQQAQKALAQWLSDIVVWYGVRVSLFRVQHNAQSYVFPPMSLFLTYINITHICTLFVYPPRACVATTLPPTKCLWLLRMYTAHHTPRRSSTIPLVHSSFALYYLCLRFYVFNGGRFSVKRYRIACRSDWESVESSLSASELAFKSVEHPCECH